MSIEQPEVREEARIDLVGRMEHELREWFDEATVLHPLPHGSFFEQIRWMVTQLEIEVDPNGERAWKVKRKKVSKATRSRVFRRDDHTCGECGWKPSANQEERKREHLRGRFLCAELIVSEHDGGRPTIKNMRTVCSLCVRNGKPSPPGVTQAKNPKGGAA